MAIQCLAVQDVWVRALGTGDCASLHAPRAVPAVAVSNPLCWPRGHLALLGGALGQDRLALLPCVGPF